MKEAQTHLIIGPGIRIDIENIREIYAKNGRSLIIHGDTINSIDINILDLSSASTVIIYAHGGIENTEYKIELASSIITNAASVFESIKQEVNIEILSCFIKIAEETSCVASPKTTSNPAWAAESVASIA